MLFISFLKFHIVFSLDVGRLSLQRQQLRPGGCGHLGSPDGDQVWIQQTLGGPCYRVSPGFSMRKVHGNAWKCTEMLELVRVFPSSRVKLNQMQTYPCSMPIWWHFWRFSLQAASPHQQHWRHNAVATREGVCDWLMVAPDGIWMWNDVDRVVYRSKSGTANNGEWLNTNIWYQLGSAKLGSNWSQFWKLRYACKRLFLYNGWRRKWTGKTSSPTKVSWTFQILVLSMRPSFRQGPFFSLPRHPLHKTSKDELAREASVDEESTWLASRRRLIRYTKN